MGVGAVIAAVSVASGIFSTVSTVKSGAQAKKRAKRAASLERERLQLQGQQRELETGRQKAALRRAARAKRASILNRAAGQGLGAGATLATSVSGAVGAVEQGVARETNLINAGASLASQADTITNQQISLDSQARQAQIFNQTLSGIASGVSLAAEGVGGLNEAGVFGG